MERNLLKPILWQAFVRWQARMIWLKDAKRTGNAWLLHCLSLHLCQGRQRGGKAHLGNFWKRWKSQASHMFLFSFAIENPGFVQALLKKRNQCWWCEGKKSWCSTMQTVLPLDFFYRWFAFCHDSCLSAFFFCFNYFQPCSSAAAFLQRLRIHQGAAAVFHLHEALQETPERHGETWRLETGITTRSVKSSLSSCRLNLLLLPSSSSFFIMFFQCFRTERSTHTHMHRKEYTHTHTHAQCCSPEQVLHSKQQPVFVDSQPFRCHAEGCELRMGWGQNLHC